MSTSAPIPSVQRYSLASNEGLSAWTEVWNAAQKPSIFASPAYLSAVSQHFGFSCDGFIVKDEDSRSAVAVFSRQKKSFSVASLPPFTPFTPLLLEHPLDEAAIHARRSPLQALLNALEGSFDDLRLHFPPEQHDVRPLQWRNWKTQPFYTYRVVMNGQDPTATWSSNPLRILKNHAAGYQFQEEGAEAAASIAALCDQSYRRQQRVFPATVEQLAACMQDLHQAGTARLFRVIDLASNEPAAGLALLTDAHSAYYWAAGSLPGPGMTILLGNLLPQLAEEGVKLFDFMGANTPSIAEFKRRFGPKLVSYMAATHTPHKLLSFLQKWRRR